MQSADIHTPDWVKDAVFYQIFPDRFARGNQAPTLEVPSDNFQPWGTPPTTHGFQGGDLPGIVGKLDYLQDLGCNALYLNPIFASASNHRYHTFDYYQVDPLLGGNRALDELLNAAHMRDMRVILDGVFNHASRGFFAFHHLMECGSDSPYIDWFRIHDWPVRAYNGRPNYDCWWELPALPAFNTDLPAVREFLWNVAVHWLERGIDGWRLDVPSEIDDDSFWREFRRRCKAVNPEAYIVGELWEEDAGRWLAGDQFDAQMNYPFMKAALGFFAGEELNQDLTAGTGLNNVPQLDGAQFGAALSAMHQRYQPEIVLAQLNMLGSHDTARILSLVRENREIVRLCFLCQMTVAGAPNIYYGDEVGMQGDNDPDCRRAFPWQLPALWDKELLADMRSYIALRHALPALRRGSFELLFADGDMVAYRRSYQGNETIVAFNSSSEPRRLSISPELPVTMLSDALDAQLPAWQAGRPVLLPPLSGRVWSNRPATPFLFGR